ncbi:MAG TPA: hypothetical protein VK666_14150 [Chryseolinea sp.]|nr:hypothetical protein [Chryseolinea sp.]
MINWKTAIGLSLLIFAAIELLTIKDNFHPDRSTFSVLIIGFVQSMIIATVLIMQGVKRNLQR